MVLKIWLLVRGATEPLMEGDALVARVVVFFLVAVFLATVFRVVFLAAALRTVFFFAAGRLVIFFFFLAMTFDPCWSFLDLGSSGPST